MTRTRNDPYNPTKPEAPLKVTGKLLDLLEALQPPNYEILPTEYLRKLFGTYTKPLIAKANAYGLIRIPLSKEARQMGARNKPTCWEQTEEGFLTATAHNRGTKLPWGDDQFAHKYLRSIIQFSFDQAPKEIEGLTKRTIADILAHRDCPPGIKTEVAKGHNPSWIPLTDTYIKPDAQLFGFAYPKPDGKMRTFYLHGFEADRGTQPLTGFDRQTIQRKVRHYCEYLRNFGYHTRYGIKNCSIAFICVNAGRARSILEVIEKEAKELAPHFIVKVTKEFGAIKICPLCSGRPTPPSEEPCEECNGRGWVPDIPPPTGHMVTEDWMQVGGKTLNIMDILKGVRNGRDREGNTDSRAA